MKMLYSSSKACIKQTLGANFFPTEIHGTDPSDFGSKGYRAYVDHKNAAPPLTEAEEEREREIQLGSTAITTATGMATVAASNAGAFPVDAAVTAAVAQGVAGEKNYVQIRLDIDGERIVLDCVETVALEDVPAKVPLDSPAFHFFRWVHTHEGKDYSPVIFIFSCPDGSANTKPAPVKQRMLYSTSKGVVEQILTSQGGAVDLRLEVNAPRDVNLDDISYKIHPPPVQKKTYAKPRPHCMQKK